MTNYREREKIKWGNRNKDKSKAATQIEKIDIITINLIKYQSEIERKNIIHDYGKGKGKGIVIPLQARCGPEVG